MRRRSRLPRRGIVHGMLALLLALALAAIGSAQEITHYTYAGHSDSWYQHLKNMAERFQAETGIQVNVIQSTGNYQEQVLTMIAGGAPPDVTDFHPQLGPTLIEQGLFTDLRPYVERSGLDLTQIPPIAVEGVTAPDGTLWSLPVSVFPVVTYFNADMFAVAGLPNPIELGEDWTWESFRESARRLTVDRNGDGQPDQYGIEGRITARWEQQVHQAGGQWFDRLVFPTQSRFNTPEVLEAVRFITGLMHEDGVVAPTSGFSIWPSVGNVAMTVVDGPGVIASYWQDATFAWDITVQPKGPASRAARVNPDGFQILRDSPNKDAAWRWIHYLVGSVDNQLEFAATTGRLPSLRDAMLRYDEQLDIQLPPNWMAFFETAFDPNGYAAYVIPANVQSTINTTIAQVWNGTLSPEDGLQRIHDVTTALLAEQNR